MELRDSRRPEWRNREWCRELRGGQQSGRSTAQNTHLNLSIINFVVRFNIYSCQSAVHHRANTDGPMHAAGGNFEFSFHLTCTSLECGKKLEHLEETQREEQTRRLKSTHKRPELRVGDFLLGGDILAITQPPGHFQYLRSCLKTH